MLGAGGPLLSLDESATLFLAINSPLLDALNTALMSNDHRMATTLSPFLTHLSKGVAKLPTHVGEVYRAVSAPMDTCHFEANSIHCWAGFVEGTTNAYLAAQAVRSTSKGVLLIFTDGGGSAVLSFSQFSSASSSATNVHHHGKAVYEYSLQPYAQPVLFLPFSRFRVARVYCVWQRYLPRVLADRTCREDSSIDVGTAINNSDPTVTIVELVAEKSK